MSERAPMPRFCAKALPHVEAGRLWRAKEYLASRISGSDYDPALCHQLGWVLLTMRDELEAGRYLFASGVRHPAYAPAIELYLARHRKGGWRQVAAGLPPSIRGRRLAELPEPLRAELEAIGMPPGSDRRRLRAEPGMSLAARSGCGLGVAVFVGTLLFLVACIGVGAPIVLQWLYDLLP